MLTRCACVLTSRCCFSLSSGLLLVLLRLLARHLPAVRSHAHNWLVCCYLPESLLQCALTLLLSCWLGFSFLSVPACSRGLDHAQLVVAGAGGNITYCAYAHMPMKRGPLIPVLALADGSGLSIF